MINKHQDAIDEIERIQEQNYEKERIEREKKRRLTCYECKRPIYLENKDFSTWAKLTIDAFYNTSLRFDCPNCGKRLHVSITINDQPMAVPF